MNLYEEYLAYFEGYYKNTTSFNHPEIIREFRQQNDKYLNYLLDMNNKPLIIVGSGPSLGKPDYRRLPPDPVIFRMQSFVFEDQYYYGDTVHAHFSSYYCPLIHPGLYEYGKDNYDIKGYFYPLSLYSDYKERLNIMDEDILKKLALYEKTFRPHCDQWSILASIPTFARLLTTTQHMPTQGMITLATALTLGFNEIHLVGYDFYQADEKYGTKIPLHVQKQVNAKLLYAGFHESLHAVKTDLAIFQMIRNLFPEAKIYSLSEESFLKTLVPMSPVLKSPNVLLKKKRSAKKKTETVEESASVHNIMIVSSLVQFIEGLAIVQKKNIKIDYVYATWTAPHYLLDVLSEAAGTFGLAFNGRIPHPEIRRFENSPICNIPYHFRHMDNLIIDAKWDYILKLLAKSDKPSVVSILRPAKTHYLLSDTRLDSHFYPYPEIPEGALRYASKLMSGLYSELAPEVIDQSIIDSIKEKIVNAEWFQKRVKPLLSKINSPFALLLGPLCYAEEAPVPGTKVQFLRGAVREILKKHSLVFVKSSAENYDTEMRLLKNSMGPLAERVIIGDVSEDGSLPPELIFTGNLPEAVYALADVSMLSYLNEGVKTYEMKCGYLPETLALDTSFRDAWKLPSLEIPTDEWTVEKFTVSSKPYNVLIPFAKIYGDIKAMQRKFSIIQKMKSGRVILYGAGQFGRGLIYFMKDETEVCFDFVMDDKPQSKFLMGIPLKNTAECDLNRKDIVILGTDTYQEEMREHLMEIGCQSKIVDISEL